MTGKLHTPLKKGPAGEAIPAPLGVWTGSTEVGASALGVCLDWTTTAPGPTGGIGTSGGADGTWSYAVDRGCNFFFHLYCFEK